MKKTQQKVENNFVPNFPPNLVFLSLRLVSADSELFKGSRGGCVCSVDTHNMPHAPPMTPSAFDGHFLLSYLLASRYSRLSCGAKPRSYCQPVSVRYTSDRHRRSRWDTDRSTVLLGPSSHLLTSS